jgi:hypothetical protein
VAEAARDLEHERQQAAISLRDQELASLRAELRRLTDDRAGLVAGCDAAVTQAKLEHEQAAASAREAQDERHAQIEGYAAMATRLAAAEKHLAQSEAQAAVRPLMMIVAPTRYDMTLSCRHRRSARRRSRASSRQRR